MEKNWSCLNSILCQLVLHNRIAASDVDEILHQYKDYTDYISHIHFELLATFNPSAK